MVDPVKDFSKVYKDDANRLTSVDCTKPMVHHVHQSMRRRPFLQITIVAPVQRLANTLNDPRARFQTAGSARRE